MNNFNYYGRLHDERKYLQKRGLDSWPLDEDLAKYVLDLEDKVDVLCRYLKVAVEKDYRNRWVVLPVKGDQHGG